MHVQQCSRVGDGAGFPTEKAFSDQISVCMVSIHVFPPLTVFRPILRLSPSSFFRSISTLQAVRGWSAIPSVLSRPFIVQVLRHLFIFPSSAHSTNMNPPKNLDLSTNFTRGNPTYVSVSYFHVRDLGTIPTRHTLPVF
jgi:hypothetical protein